MKRVEESITMRAFRTATICTFAESLRCAMLACPHRAPDTLNCGNPENSSADCNVTTCPFTAVLREYW